MLEPDEILNLIAITVPLANAHNILTLKPLGLPGAQVIIHVLQLEK